MDSWTNCRSSHCHVFCFVQGAKGLSRVEHLKFKGSISSGQLDKLSILSLSCILSLVGHHRLVTVLLGVERWQQTANQVVDPLIVMYFTLTGHQRLVIVLPGVERRQRPAEQHTNPQIKEQTGNPAAADCRAAAERCTCCQGRYLCWQ